MLQEIISDKIGMISMLSKGGDGMVSNNVNIRELSRKNTYFILF